MSCGPGCNRNPPQPSSRLRATLSSRSQETGCRGHWPSASPTPPTSASQCRAARRASWACSRRPPVGYVRCCRRAQPRRRWSAASPCIASSASIRARTRCARPAAAARSPGPCSIPPPASATRRSTRRSAVAERRAHDARRRRTAARSWVRTRAAEPGRVRRRRRALTRAFAAPRLAAVTTNRSSATARCW
jgi:hypothetical protein